MNLEEQNAELKMDDEEIGQAVINLNDAANNTNFEDSILERLAKLEIGNTYVPEMLPGKLQVCFDEVVNMNKKIKKGVRSLIRNIRRHNTDTLVRFNDFKRAAFCIFANTTSIINKFPSLLEEAIHSQRNGCKDIAEETAMQETIMYMQTSRKTMEQIKAAAAYLLNDISDLKEFEKVIETFQEPLDKEAKKCEADSAEDEADTNATVSHFGSGASGHIYNHQQDRQQGIYLGYPPIQEDQISSSTQFDADVQILSYQTSNTTAFGPIRRSSAKRVRRTGAAPRVRKRRHNN